jgi:hypothetical protein
VLRRTNTRLTTKRGKPLMYISKVWPVSPLGITINMCYYHVEKQAKTWFVMVCSARQFSRYVQMLRLIIV